METHKRHPKVDVNLSPKLSSKSWINLHLKRNNTHNAKLYFPAVTFDENEASCSELILQITVSHRNGTISNDGSYFSWVVLKTECAVQQPLLPYVLYAVLTDVCGSTCASLLVRFTGTETVLAGNSPAHPVGKSSPNAVSKGNGSVASL